MCNDVLQKGEEFCFTMRFFKQLKKGKGDNQTTAEARVMVLQLCTSSQVNPSV